MDHLLSHLAAPFSFPQGEHGVLLIHGFTGSPAHMLPLGEALHKEGFAIQGLLLPGHGTSPRDMGQVGWQDWLQAARLAAREMAGKYGHFSVAGLSMGGVLALLLAQEMDLTACVSIAAPMKTLNRFRWLAPLGSLFHPMIEKQADGPRPGMDERYDVGYTAYPTKSVHDLSVLMGKARQHLSLIHCPLLAVQSRKDETVTPDSPEIILQGISSSVKASLWLEEAPHVCTISPEYPRIAQAITEFLRKAER
ncbi:MAG: alpha/beta fold hydrolase [Clostridiales bacterium]|nr:alpha/beta fold hydrolase [Clostridiales bacterium]